MGDRRDSRPRNRAIDERDFLLRSIGIEIVVLLDPIIILSKTSVNECSQKFDIFTFCFSDIKINTPTERNHFDKTISQPSSVFSLRRDSYNDNNN